ncbi:hypothetical protein VYU27_003003 [Nannochloropsis oceanica]
MPPEDGQSEVSVTTGIPVNSGSSTCSTTTVGAEHAFAALSMEGLSGDSAGATASSFITSTIVNASSSARASPPHTSPTHRTLPLEQAIPSTRAHSPLSLTQLCLVSIAENSAGLVSIEGLAEELCIRLLREVLVLGKLDFRLCRVFMESEHEELSKAVASLNLFDALGCVPARGSGFGGCRR